MSRAVADDGPAHFTIPIVRGDDYSRVFEFYSSYAGVQGDTTTTALDLSGRTYTSSIADTWGGTVVAAATPTCTVGGASDNEVTWALTDAETDALTARTYVADIVENAGTSSERTVIKLTLKVEGRATP